MERLALRFPSPSIINRAVAQRRTVLLKRIIVCELLISKLFKLLSSGTQTLSK